LENTQVNPSAYFNDRDSTVFIINHPNNIDFTKDQIITLDCNRNLFQSIRKEIPENCSVFLSQKRGLMIFEASGNWNKASVKELFINGQHKIHFTKLRHFNFGPSMASIQKTNLLFTQKKLLPPNAAMDLLLIKKPIIALFLMKKRNQS